MSRVRNHRDDERDELIPEGLSGPVAAATIEALHRIAEAMESHYLGQILRNRPSRDTRQRDLWD